MILIVIVSDISDVELRIVIGSHRTLFLRGLKAKVIIGVIHHALYVSLGSQCKNLIIILRLLNALKVSAKEVFWHICLLDGEALSSD